MDHCDAHPSYVVSKHRSASLIFRIGLLFTAAAGRRPFCIRSISWSRAAFGVTSSRPGLEAIYVASSTAPPQKFATGCHRQVKPLRRSKVGPPSPWKDDGFCRIISLGKLRLRPPGPNGPKQDLENF